MMCPGFGVFNLPQRDGAGGASSFSLNKVEKVLDLPNK